jgi:hypothetical protein
MLESIRGEPPPEANLQCFYMQLAHHQPKSKMIYNYHLPRCQNYFLHPILFVHLKKTLFVNCVLGSVFYFGLQKYSDVI